MSHQSWRWGHPQWGSGFCVVGCPGHCWLSWSPFSSARGISLFSLPPQRSPWTEWHRLLNWLLWWWRETPRDNDGGRIQRLQAWISGVTVQVTLKIVFHHPFSMLTFKIPLNRSTHFNDMWVWDRSKRVSRGDTIWFKRYWSFWGAYVFASLFVETTTAYLMWVLWTAINYFVSFGGCPSVDLSDKTFTLVMKS